MTMLIKNLIRCPMLVFTGGDFVDGDMDSLCVVDVREVCASWNAEWRVCDGLVCMKMM